MRTLASFPLGSHLSVVKLVASATLKPWLKPAPRHAYRRQYKYKAQGQPMALHVLAFITSITPPSLP